MSSITEVREALNITVHAWKNYIADGVILKQKPSEYEVGRVAQQIIRDKSHKINKSKGEKTKHLSQIKKLEERLYESNSGDGEFDPNNPKKVKEKLDLEILEEKLIKVKFDNKVRKKQYIPRDMFIEFVTSIATEFASMLDPIPTDIKQQMPDMNSRTFNKLKKDIAVKRNLLADHIEGNTVNELLIRFDPESDLASNDTTEDS